MSEDRPEGSKWWTQKKEYSIVPPTEQEKKEWSMKRQRNPRLPQNPPMEIGVGLPLPSNEENPPRKVQSQSSFPDKLKRDHSSTFPDEEERLWKEFSRGYQFHEPSTQDGQKEFDKIRESHRSNSASQADYLVGQGKLDPDEVNAWIEKEMTGRARNSIKAEAFEKYRNEKHRGDFSRNS